MTVERWVVLEPLDTIVVRDGRAFDAGLQSVARTNVPTPGTLAGAIGAAYGAPPGAGLRADSRGRLLPERLLGPIPVVYDRGAWRARWPCPLDVVRDDDDPAPYRLAVTEVGDDRQDLEGGVGALAFGAGEPVTGWWETAELARYLRTGDVSGETVAAPWCVERRVGLALDDNGVAAEGMLYSAEHLRPDELAGRTGFAVCCIGGPDTDLPGTVPLGGRNKSAQVHIAVDPPELPPPATSAPDGHLLLYLATPGVFAGGWRPDISALRGAELVSAVVGDPQVIAAATPDRATGAVGGGRLMWAAPPGSVYYLKFASEDAALAAAASLERTTLPQVTEPLATAGFGHAMTGSWSPDAC